MDTSCWCPPPPHLNRFLSQVVIESTVFLLLTIQIHVSKQIYVLELRKFARLKLIRLSNLLTRSCVCKLVGCVWDWSLTDNSQLHAWQETVEVVTFVKFDSKIRPNNPHLAAAVQSYHSNFWLNKTVIDNLRQWPTWYTLALFYNTFILILYMFRALYAHHQEVELSWCSIWYRHSQ